MEAGKRVDSETSPLGVVLGPKGECEAACTAFASCHGFFIRDGSLCFLFDAGYAGNLVDAANYDTYTRQDVACRTAGLLEVNRLVPAVKGMWGIAGEVCFWQRAQGLTYDGTLLGVTGLGYAGDCAVACRDEPGCIAFTKPTFSSSSFLPSFLQAPSKCSEFE